MRLLTAATLCALIGFVGIASARAETTPIGKRIDEFRISDVYNAEHRLSELPDDQLVVLAFIGTECPLARLYAPRLQELAEEFSDQNVAFFGVSSNVHDNVTELKNYARVHGIEFPILKDVGNALADRLGAIRVPEVFVLDADGVVRYWGRVDDQYGLQSNETGVRVSYQLDEPRRHDLAIALRELLGGEEVSVPVTEATGCLIGRIKQPVENAEVTYSNQIVRIFNEHCVVCHREGQIGPFTLTSYEDAAGWAEMINEVVQERRMPPWHADPRYGEFVNDCRLSDEEMAMIDAWADSGAPEGDVSDLPEPPEFAEGWMIPEPDEVIYMPLTFDVPAEGTVDYQNFVVDPGWTEDKWVTAMEPKPGNPAVVHHIVMYVIPPKGVSKYYSADLPKTALDWFASFAPGLRPPVLPEGTARFIPAGSKLNFQMHYTPNGTAQSDRSCVGIKFADPETVRREVAVQHAGNHNFVIPAHANNHEVESWYEFGEESLLWSVSPHMHVRGKDFKYTLIYPDGTEEIVLDVPQYDFGWQTTYIFAEPKRVPKGSKLHCVAHYDNSEDNLNNPDPTIDVRLGPQTWEEMMYGWFEICLADQDIIAERLAGPPDPQERMKESLARIENGDATVDAALVSAAAAACDSREAFAAFAELLAEMIGQIDRVDVTYVQADKGRLRNLQVVELNGIRTTFRTTSTVMSADDAVLADYIAAGSEPIIHPDVAAVEDKLMQRMAGKGIASSLHLPLRTAEGNYLLSFWSQEPDAFPDAIVAFLSEVAGHLKLPAQ